MSVDDLQARLHKAVTFTNPILPGLIDRAGIQRELMVSQKVAEQIVRRLPTYRFGDLRKVYVRRDHVLQLLDRSGTAPTTHTPTVAAAVDGPVLPLEQTWNEWLATRHDVKDKTIRNSEAARDAAIKHFGRERNLATLTTAQAREYIGWLAGQYKPGTVTHYKAALAALLEFCELPTNPVRHRSVRAPRASKPERQVMSGTQLAAILAQVGDERKRTFLRLLDACALRGGEASALIWRDVDTVGGRIRIAGSRSKGNTGGQRWLPVPGPVLDAMVTLTPEQDRVPDSRVFGGLGTGTMRACIYKAGEKASVHYLDDDGEQRLFNPHSLRHRRISLWVAAQMDDAQVTAWSGHKKREVMLNDYTHVAIDPADDPWREFWIAAYRKARALPELLLQRAAGNGDAAADALPASSLGEVA